MAPIRVDVPALTIGASFLGSWPINGRSAHIDWRESSYGSMAPATFELHDVTVHSSAGIVQIGNEVLYESLAHTDATSQGYEVTDGKLFLQPRHVTHLAGTHITILAGVKANYFHSIIERVARLAIVQPHYFNEASSILVTEGAMAQDFALGRLGLPPPLKRRAATDEEAFRVDRLIFPWTVHGDGDFHPCLVDIYDRIAVGIGNSAQDLPKRVYVDRRGAELRPLLNEDEVIGKLRPFGFVPVKPESLALEDQVRLFRDATAIVAPHGAGLTNLGYCRPGTIVLELLMDGYVNWCFRRLAAIRGLRYDCVLGRSIDPWTAGMANPHALRWNVSADHVAGAAEFMFANA